MNGGRLAILKRPGGWFWLAIAVGALLRGALVVGTEGSFDVSIKLHHGHQINRVGLLGWYEMAEVFNHPPLMGSWFAGAVRFAEATGLPFAAVLRAPFALLDLATAALVWLAFAGSPWRWAACAAYWLNPLAVIFSAYHGNTDSALGAFALASLVAVSRGRPVLAGAVLGVGLWVKLPVLIAAPALLLGFAHGRDRARFAAAAALVGLAGYLPWLAQEPGLLIQRIAGYGGSPIETPAGAVIWGLPAALRFGGTPLADALAAVNTLVCWVPILLLAWWRRGDPGARVVGVSVCGGFLAVYGVTSFWAWQYLAWCVPFLLFLDARVAAALSIVLGAYVYGAYAFLTGSPWLLGHWDIAAHAAWPIGLALLRDASVLLCFGVALALLASAGLVRARGAAT